MDDVERSGGSRIVGRAGAGCQADRGEPNARLEFGERGGKHLESVARAVRGPVRPRSIRCPEC